MNTPVYSPSIQDDAAKSLYHFCKKYNTRNQDSSIRVLGYLHGNRGAKLRIEPVETCSTRHISKWKRLARETNCRIMNISVNASEGHVDICTEYKPSDSIIKVKWQQLLLPAVILIILLKYSGMLQAITGYQI